MPEEIFSFLTTVQFTCFDFKFLDILPIPWIEDKLLSLFEIPVFNHGLQKLDYASGSVIINYFQLFKTLLLHLSVHICVLPFIWRRLHSESKLAKQITKIRSFFIYNSYIKIYIEAFFFLFLITFLEIVNFQKINVPSYAVACLMLLLVIVFVAIIPIHYFTQRKNFSDLSSSRMQVLYDGIRETTWQRGLYTFLFLMRRLVIVSLIILSKSISYASYVFLLF